MTIRLKIEHSRPPTEEDFQEFWDTFISRIEEMHLYAFMSSNRERSRWCLYTAYTDLSVGVIIDDLFNLLAEKPRFFKKFRFSVKHKPGNRKPGENPKPYLPGCSL